MVINDDASEAAENDNVFSDCRKVDKDGADATLSGRLFHTVGPTTLSTTPVKCSHCKKVKFSHTGPGADPGVQAVSPQVT